ncbi:MAG: peptidoglycan editing factor PgeF [Alphaproteobacteria bacterium]
MEVPFSTPPFIRAGFFTRQGGVSAGIYASLNCGPGSGDAPEAVAENRRRVASAFGVNSSQLCTLHQVHSADVVIVNSPFAERPKADAMVSNTPGLMLGILTADCAPVLFYDAKNHVIGAAHAGWKGATSGILENTLRTMQSLGAQSEHIHAAIGPTIAQASYEVGPEFLARFNTNDQARFFIPSPRTRHAMFDLPGYVEARLQAAGLRHITNLAMDTLPDEARFFSYRRATLAREPDYGRQVSAIMIPPGSVS